MGKKKRKEEVGAVKTGTPYEPEEFTPPPIQKGLDQSCYGFLNTAMLMHILQLTKGLKYRNSWQRRGDMGVLHNVFRKIDRIENLVEDEIRHGGQAVPSSESMVETVADLAVYAVKWLDWFCQTRPSEFYAWWENLLTEARNAGVLSESHSFGFDVHMDIGRPDVEYRNFDEDRKGRI